MVIYNMGIFNALEDATDDKRHFNIVLSDYVRQKELDWYVHKKKENILLKDLDLDHNKIKNLGDPEDPDDAATKNFVYRRFQKVVADYNLDKIVDKWKAISDEISQLQDNITANRKVIQTNQEKLSKSIKETEQDIEENVKNELGDKVQKGFQHVRELIDELNENMINNDKLQEELDKIVNQFRARYDDFNTQLETSLNDIKEELRKLTRRKIREETDELKNALSQVYTIQQVNDKFIEARGSLHRRATSIEESVLKLTGGTMQGDINMGGNKILVENHIFDNSVANNLTLKVLSRMHGTWPPVFIYILYELFNYFSEDGKFRSADIRREDGVFILDQKGMSFNSIYFSVFIELGFGGEGEIVFDGNIIFEFSFKSSKILLALKIPGREDTRKQVELEAATKVFLTWSERSVLEIVSGTDKFKHPKIHMPMLQEFPPIVGGHFTRAVKHVEISGSCFKF